MAKSFKEKDPTAEDRKKDHIELAFEASTRAALNDSRFNYEPLLAAHPGEEDFQPFTFLDQKFHWPFWVSSMTGGTDHAARINRNLATIAGKYGFGMGLGSCRSLLTSKKHLADFNVRKYLGPLVPLYANLGIAQVGILAESGQLDKLHELVDLLQANGLIIHVNPAQEWLQPEGDQIKVPPLETIRQVVEETGIPIIVKEVGQGMGPASLAELIKIPLAAIELAAFGGTNFSLLEIMRSSGPGNEILEPLTKVGHTAGEMVQMLKWSLAAHASEIKTKGIIISGGISNFLDGYYLYQKLDYPCVIGQASGMLRYAKESEDALDQYIQTLIRAWMFASAFLKVK